MKHLSRFLSLLLAALMICAPSLAEISDEDMEYWDEQMWVLVEDIGARQTGTEGAQLALEHICAEMETMGYSAEEGTLLLDDVPLYGPNVIAIRPAVNEHPHILIVGAHYDSVVPGARDNASGAAALLTLANKFARMEPYEDTEIRFVAFSAEEIGHFGSLTYAARMTEDEKERTLGMFNLDITTVGMIEQDIVFSCDTMGMRTEGGYVTGTAEEPVINKPARAILQAIADTETFDPADAGVTHCVPRHLGESDHESFHIFHVESANVCFRGNVEAGGHWTLTIHKEEDGLTELDTDRTWELMNVLDTAVEGLAADASYGD